MIILIIRTDTPEAEIGLYDNSRQLAHDTWTAHRQLGVSIHARIDGLLNHAGYSLDDIQGIIGFQGPGSFTGLRIGLTVANSLAYSLQCPIVGSDSDEWIETGVVRLSNGDNDKTVMPRYGAEVHITQQKK